MTRDEMVCIGCPDPEHGDVYDFCFVHGHCEGCRNPERGDIEQGDLHRFCPMHGIVAEEQRHTMRSGRSQEDR